MRAFGIGSSMYVKECWKSNSNLLSIACKMKSSSDLTDSDSGVYNPRQFFTNFIQFFARIDRFSKIAEEFIYRYFCILIYSCPNCPKAPYGYCSINSPYGYNLLSSSSDGWWS